MPRARRSAKSTATATQPVDAASQSDLAYARLREAIIALELQPGQMYSETHLASFAKLGRTPVREALHRLIREELVTPRRNRGIQITPIDIIRHLQLLDVRRALEQLLVDRASKHATQDERRIMLQLATDTEAAIASNNMVKLLHLNSQVQDLKVQAAHNEILTSTMDLFYGLSRRFWFAYAPHIEGSRESASLLHV
ncbi:MAG: GntR family transcriptional regulator, partial [Planctomycetota bacterium]